MVIAIAAAIWWNDWTVGIRPGREAHKAMEEFHRGVPWPDAVVAADATLPVGRQYSGHCRLADGQLAYFGRWKSGYMTQLPEVSKEFLTRDLCARACRNSSSSHAYAVHW